MVMIFDVFSHRERFSQTMDAANLVLGGLLGAYLGLLISQKGAAGGYLNLFWLLFFLVQFCYFLNGSIERIYRGATKLGLIYLIISMFLAIAVYYYSLSSAVEPKILLTILAVWFAIMVSELVSMTFIIDRVQKERQHD
ncbi:hypothetical protein [Sphingomonas sp. Leaf17]|uniref:hypothetical protein n=1 Tax=Sphingomonas sp. Leaf17 TaxID=1735683 RepID=UPI00138EEF33|nr:hypothetical protein [Sphingomonas sp. Leaf17]